MSWREKEYLGINDLRDILGIRESSAYALMHRLPHIKVGKTLRVNRVAFEQWLKEQERKNA